MYSFVFSFLSSHIIIGIQAHPLDGAQALGDLFEFKHSFLRVFHPRLPINSTSFPTTKEINLALISSETSPSPKQTMDSVDHSQILTMIYGGDHIITSSSQTTSRPSNPETIASQNVPKLQTKRSSDPEIYSCGTKYKASLRETDQCF
ncbi:hypothetical protein DSO57_1010598 [Entomophthora muscae]|uniref:Uncharacterized protein n=1 Tax=Entomophthora muscae TaxID=34485 RepID=A0ACC2URG9_9FUNG|nr:hypothetical protein DSO57_1010598 [Entomophthora muscae]